MGMPSFFSIATEKKGAIAPLTLIKKEVYTIAGVGMIKCG